MKMCEVPDQYKVYSVRVSNGSHYTVDGMGKAAILAAKTNFIEMRSGDVINKAFITEIRLDKDATREKVLANRNLLLEP